AAAGAAREDGERLARAHGLARRPADRRPDRLPRAQRRGPGARLQRARTVLPAEGDAAGHLPVHGRVRGRVGTLLRARVLDQLGPPVDFGAVRLEWEIAKRGWRRYAAYPLAT